MNKFQESQRYYQDGITYEIQKRTKKTLTYNAIQHAGRYNEKVLKQKTTRIKIWDNREVFF